MQDRATRLPGGAADQQAKLSHVGEHQSPETRDTSVAECSKRRHKYLTSDSVIEEILICFLGVYVLLSYRKQERLM